MPAYEHMVVLRWPRPDRGEIKILRAKPDVMLRPGDDLTEAQFARNGYLIEGPPPSSDTLFDAERFLQYIPALAVDGHCYVGQPRRYLAGPEVKDLTADYVSDTVSLRWTWPELCDGALVAWDENGELPDPLAARSQARVSRNQDETTGRFDISWETGPKLFVLVATVARTNGHEFVSSGSPFSVQRPRIILRYQVRSVRGPGGRRSELVLKPERPDWLPALELRGRADNRSAGRNDPLLLELAAGRSERELVKKFELGSAQLRSCRLFVANDAEDYVQIIHPA
jgi:hypothetical protein